MFDTLPAADADPRTGGSIEVAQHGVDQRRLADPRLAAHEPDLPLAARRSAPPISDRAALARATDHDRLRSRVEVDRPLCVAWERPGCTVAPRRDESIAASRDGLDKTRLGALVTKRSAQLADRQPNDVFGNRHAAPDGIEQRPFGHQLARAFH